jgi:hypothetical protein
LSSSFLTTFLFFTIFLTTETASKKSSDGDTRKIEINLKMNGRDLQNFIVSDTKILK